MVWRPFPARVDPVKDRGRNGYILGLCVHGVEVLRVGAAPGIVAPGSGGRVGAIPSKGGKDIGGILGR